ncbi:MAG TPA: hypothetical protein DD379_17560 [Cyanobacteria bacterium UBA11162]|nr:hypothetical protein [Cyanobacteria bacterium UBA11162]
MIPSFDENGNLPPGIHWAEWSEFKERYGTNLKRVRMIQGLEAAMEALKVAGCRAIYINGSFISREREPNDFDACWDSEQVDFNLLQTIAPTLLNYDNKRAAQKVKYQGEIFRSDQVVDTYGTMSIDFFQRDRFKNTKGIIAIDLLRWEP